MPKDPALESYFSEMELEPLFVKNLESVQGDESPGGTVCRKRNRGLASPDNHHHFMQSAFAGKRIFHRGP